jgi:membrane protease subunit (stomatin/prohibitin family)
MTLCATISANRYYLRAIIVQRFADVLGEQQLSLLDLPGDYNELAEGTKAHLAHDFAAIGLVLLAFYINAITPTEDTARAIDERAAMGAIGDINAYLTFKAARAMGDAALNQSGGGAEGFGLGASIGLGAGLAGGTAAQVRTKNTAVPMRMRARSYQVHEPRPTTTRSAVEITTSIGRGRAVSASGASAA